MFGHHRIPTVRVEDVPEDLTGTAILDVREDDEWAAGHLPGAVHIPLHQLPLRLAEVPASGDAPVLVVCHVGARSAQAVAWLNAQGHRAANLEGGLDAWSRAGRPLESTR
jgi:rhodanese-related sulfurtransferase